MTFQIMDISSCDFWKDLLSEINKKMPKLNIVIHGHQESYRETLLNYKNIIFTKNIKDSLNICIKVIY